MADTYTTLPVIKAQFAYDYLHDGDHVVYHRECARIPLALAMGRNRALLFRIFL